MTINNESDCPDLELVLNCTPANYPFSQGSWGNPVQTNLVGLNPNCLVGTVTLKSGNPATTLSFSSTTCIGLPHPIKGCFVGTLCCAGNNCITNNWVDVWLKIDAMGNWVLTLEKQPAAKSKSETGTMKIVPVSENY